MNAPTTDPTARISRDDLETQFRTLKSDIDHSAEAAATRSAPFLVVGAVAVLVLAYVIGKRVGKKKSTVVEIRRI